MDSVSTSFTPIYTPGALATQDLDLFNDYAKSLPARAKSTKEIFSRKAKNDLPSATPGELISFAEAIANPGELSLADDRLEQSEVDRAARNEEIQRGLSDRLVGSATGRPTGDLFDGMATEDRTGQGLLMSQDLTQNEGETDKEFRNRVKEAYSVPESLDPNPEL